MRTVMKNNDDAMAAVAPSGNVALDFARMMRIHHQGAIGMAEQELLHGSDPQMKPLATQIIAATQVHTSSRPRPQVRKEAARGAWHRYVTTAAAVP